MNNYTFNNIIIFLCRCYVSLNLDVAVYFIVAFKIM